MIKFWKSLKNTLYKSLKLKKMHSLNDQKRTDSNTSRNTYRTILNGLLHNKKLPTILLLHIDVKLVLNFCEKANNLIE